MSARRVAPPGDRSPHLGRPLVSLLVLLVAACRSPALPSAPPPGSRLVIEEPRPLGQIEVGRQVAVPLTVSNRSPSSTREVVDVEAPCSGPRRLELDAHSVTTLALSCAPDRPGAFVARVRVGAAQAVLSGEGVEPLRERIAPDCHESCDGFRCPVPDGVACGPQRCDAPSALMCRSGRCVEAERAPTHRCIERWLADAPSTSGTAAWDAVRKTVVLFTTTGETWEWRQRWRQRFPLASPGPRSAPGLAYDPSRQTTVLFGGAAGLRLLDDTWEWDGTSWLRRPLQPSPPARSQPALGWDAVNHRLLLVGGRGPAGWRRDAWALDQQWAPLAMIPEPTEAPRLVTTEGGPLLLMARGAAALVDGGWQVRREVSPARSPPGAGDGLPLDASPHLFLAGADVWEANGSGWLAHAASPLGPRDDAALAWDPFHERVVLFGGQREGRALGDTWHREDETWRDVTPEPSPPPRVGHALAWDAVRRRVVLFGGQGDTLLNDTWEWNAGPKELSELGGRICGLDAEGLRWARSTPDEAPSPRRGHALAWDAARQRVVLFGGFDGRAVLDDTWTWNGSTWRRVTTSPSPPARQGHTLVWHPAAQHVLLAAGVGGRGAAWAWDGTGWTELPWSVPTAAQLVWHPPTVSLLALNGDSGQAFRLEGVSVVRAPTFEPVPRGVKVAFDGESDSLVGFDGRRTWRYVATPAPAPRGASAAE